MLTVVLATRNRAALLTRTLEAMTRFVPPRGGWALLVVDNDSTDTTPGVLTAFAPRLPLRTLTEPRAGMTAALNAALPHLRGDLMVKTDDDVLAEPDWLSRYRDAADSYPETTLFGGTVLLEWPHAPPRWLWQDPRALGMLYALSRPAEGPCSPHAIYGPHWAIRSAVLSHGLRFAEAIGPDQSKSAYVMGGESELFARLAASGHLGRHVAAARTRHIVRPEQLAEPWILDRAFSCGRGAVVVARPGRRPAGTLRRTAWRTLAQMMRPLPRSQLRLRALLTDRLLAGMTDARRTLAASQSAPAPDRGALTVEPGGAR